MGSSLCKEALQRGESAPAKGIQPCNGGRASLGCKSSSGPLERAVQVVGQPLSSRRRRSESVRCVLLRTAAALSRPTAIAARPSLFTASPVSCDSTLALVGQLLASPRGAASWHALECSSSPTFTGSSSARRRRSLGCCSEPLLASVELSWLACRAATAVMEERAFSTFAAGSTLAANEAPAYQDLPTNETPLRCGEQKERRTTCGLVPSAFRSLGAASNALS